MNDTERVFKEIEEADAILIGASNGLSISEGIHIFADNSDFRTNFAEFRNDMGIQSIINGCFFPYRKEEERWAFYSRMYSYFNIGKDTSNIMQNLASLVKDKNYFVVTSNIDAHFQKAGFDRKRIFEIEVNCSNMQCSNCCHDNVYPAEELLIKMSEQQHQGKVPTELLPECPKCGGNMRLHIETDQNFVKDKNWRTSAETYQNFCNIPADKKIVLLELGVGMRNQLIKRPFMDFTYKNPNATYITFNKGEIYIPSQISHRSIAMDGNIADHLYVLSNMTSDEHLT